MVHHRMILNRTAYIGRGAISEIPEALVGRGFAKALVVTDAILVANGVAGKVTSLLDAAGFPYEVFDAVMPNPSIEAVQQGVAAFDASGADCLLAIGGGSPQDTCKAVGIIAANREFADVRSLEGGAPTKNPCVPIVAVPTTAGTAAEVTINYVITDVQNHRKFVCFDPHDIPIVAVVDADMMDAMPTPLKVATPDGRFDPRDRDTPHGVANGVLLPHVMAFNAATAGEKFRDVARAMGVPGVGGMPLHEAQDAAVKAVDSLARELGIPLTLRELGVKEADLPALTEAALADVRAGGNPRQGSYDEVLALYNAIY